MLVNPDSLGPQQRADLPETTLLEQKQRPWTIKKPTGASAAPVGLVL